MKRVLIVASLQLAALTMVSQADATDRLHRQLHMTAASAAKCKAFHKVVTDTQGLQRVHGGSLPAGARRRLEQELRRAHAMRPSSLTPMQCGVPL